jgi:hypothetical protein
MFTRGPDEFQAVATNTSATAAQVAVSHHIRVCLNPQWSIHARHPPPTGRSLAIGNDSAAAGGGAFGALLGVLRIGSAI